MAVVKARLRTVALLMLLLLLAACTSSPNEAGGSGTYSLCTGAVLPSGAVPAPAPTEGDRRGRPPWQADGDHRAPGKGVDDVIRQADQLVKDRHLDAAAALYRYRLEKDPTDACAARGLAFIAALRAPPTTVVGAAAGRWDGFYKSRIVPGFSILVPFAVVLAVLLGLVHLLTRRVVTPDTVVLQKPAPWRKKGTSRTPARRERRRSRWDARRCGGSALRHSWWPHGSSPPTSTRRAATR